MSMLFWFGAVLLGGILGYLFGKDAGYRQGNQSGYIHALRQALEVERPFHQLCRVLVPIPVDPPPRDSFPKSDWPS